MIRPVLLAVDDEPAARSSIEGELLHPAAKRALLTGWGDLQVGDRLVRAAVLGQVDD